MAWTSAQLSALEAAYASGRKRVKFPNGEEIEYRDLDEMKRIIIDVKRELGTATRYGRKYAQHSKGFGS